MITLQSKTALHCSLKGEEGRTVISGDTAYFPQMVDFAKNADIFVHEAIPIDGVETFVARMINGNERL